jgi:hypothetical protein
MTQFGVGRFRACSSNISIAASLGVRIRLGRVVNYNKLTRKTSLRSNEK